MSKNELLFFPPKRVPPVASPISLDGNCVLWLFRLTTSVILASCLFLIVCIQSFSHSTGPPLKYVLNDHFLLSNTITVICLLLSASILFCLNYCNSRLTSLCSSLLPSLYSQHSRKVDFLKT